MRALSIVRSAHRGLSVGGTRRTGAPADPKEESVCLGGEQCRASASRAESPDIEGGSRPPDHVARIEQPAPGETTSLDYLWAGACGWSPVGSGRRLAAEAAWEWLESTGRVSGREAERHPPAPQNKRSRRRRSQRKGAGTAEAVAHAPDLEQLKQERREALQLAVAIGTSPRMSESDTEISQPPSDRPATPDRLSELGFLDCLAVTPATADNLF
ncbi:hypothetical protein NDU88_001554 [Pleurodeles waltl]|uniref:Uncharacterized protein n=1 Tax=Pleurodeles waltl TaxID=8319 RepID=A0AAV7P442_PLEWA|nr:hypothetical protein NDU88_001554 [Pleurodeles waltl]